MSRWLRIASVPAAAALAAAVMAWALIALVNAVDPKVGLSQPQRVQDIRNRMAGIARSSDVEGRLDIVHFGDSSVYNQTIGLALVERFSDRLRRKLTGRALRVHVLADPGLDTFSFYFMSRRVAKSRPELALVSLNTASLSTGWRSVFAFPEMSSLLELSEVWPTLGLPIEWIGLTADALLRNSLIVRCGLFEAWQNLSRFQLRVGTLRQEIGKSLPAALGGDGEKRLKDRRNLRRMRSRLLPRGETGTLGASRYSDAGYRVAYGAALAGVGADHPMLRALGSMIGVLHRAGIPVLVYASPFNVEHMQSVGIDDLSGIDRSLDAVRKLVQAEGGYFADLHATQPEGAFYDHGPHLFFEELESPTTQLAEQLATLVARLVEREGRL